MGIWHKKKLRIDTMNELKQLHWYCFAVLEFALLLVTLSYIILQYTQSHFIIVLAQVFQDASERGIYVQMSDGKQKCTLWAARKRQTPNVLPCQPDNGAKLK
jgi:hypothetical protein